MLGQFIRRKKSTTQPALNPTLAERFPDVDREFLDVYSSVQSATMTSPERVFALCDAVDYVCRADIVGDIVECGVWRGGSMMAVIKRLTANRQINRKLWLFDTYCGMPEPTSIDVDLAGNEAIHLMKTSDANDPKSIWCNSTLQEVQTNIRSTSYPDHLVNYVEGDVCDTLNEPENVPERIAVLRLDTDWYESTRVELERLFPKLSPGGVLIIDDYGHWGGCRQAVDEYLNSKEVKILLQRIDYTGRMGVKLD